MYNATVDESGLLYPPKHHLIVLMGVNHYVTNNSCTIIKATIVNTLDRAVRSNAVDCAIRLIVYPLAFNFRICRVIFDYKCKSPDYSVAGLNYIAYSFGNITAYQIYRRIRVPPHCTGLPDLAIYVLAFS